MVAIFVVIGWLYSISLRSNDFLVFLEASRSFYSGVDLYSDLKFTRGAEYFYSPFFAMAVRPFTWHDQVGVFIWLVLNLFFLYRIVTLCHSFLAGVTVTPGLKRLITVVALAFTMRFLLYNFQVVQTTLFLLWAVLESQYLNRRHKFALGGLLLGVAINIKLLPIVLIPYLIFRVERRILMWTLVSIAGALVLPACVVGWDANFALHRSWIEAIDPTRSLILDSEFELFPHSLHALILPLFTAGPGELPYSRQIMSLDTRTAQFVLYAVISALIASTLYFTGIKPFRRAKSQVHAFWELSYILMLIPLIFPHQQKYAFSFLLPAAFYLAYYVAHGKALGRNSGIRYQLGCICIGLAFVLMTMTTDGLIGRELNLVTQHFKLITIGALVAIVPMALFHPAHIDNRSGTP